MPRPRRGFTIASSVAATIALLVGCAATPQEKYARYIQRGKKLLESANYPRAIVEFRGAMQLQPKEAEAYYWLAQVFLSENKVADAVVALRKAIEVKPGYAPAQLKLSDLMIRSRDEQLLKDAESRLQNVLTGNPGDDDALLTLAAAEVQLGKPDDAEKYLKEVVQRSPANLRPKMALALLKVSEKDLAGAEEVLKGIVQQTPSSDDAVVALANLYVGTGRFAEAEGLFMKGVQLNPDNTDAWISLGSVQLEMGKMGAAEQSFKRAAESPKTKAPLAYVVFLMRQNRRPQAIAQLEKMFKADANNRAVRSALVAVYLTGNRQPEAETILNDALKKNPNDFEALLQQSQVYFRKRKFSNALADLNLALSFSPNSAQAHYLRSRIFGVREDQEKRREDLVATLRMAPDSIPARFDLADALLRANKPKEALETLDQAMPDQKRTLEFAIAYNWALIGNGDGSAARKSVDRLLASSKSPQLMLQDGVLKFAARDFTGARSSLEQVLRETPDDVRALSLLADSYVAQNQRSPATRRIEEAARAQPKSVPVQMVWIRWLIGDNQIIEARRALAATIAANPTSTEPLLVSAGLDFNNGQLAGARSALINLFRLDDQNFEACMLAGQVEEASGHYLDAAAYYKKVLDLDSSNLFALNNLAYVLSRDAAHVEEALGLARRAKDKAPESPEVLDTLGWLYYRKGMYDLAAKELEHALTKADWPAIQFHLGLTYSRLGDTGKGGRLMAAALARDPKLGDSEVFR